VIRILINPFRLYMDNEERLRPYLYVVQSSFEVSPKTEPVLDKNLDGHRDEARRNYLVGYLKISIPPVTEQPIDEVAADFLDSFCSSKTLAEYGKLPSRETAIFSETNLQRLIEISQEELESAIQRSKSKRDSTLVSEQILAYKEVFEWCRIRAVLETIWNLHPPKIALTAHTGA
jgi:hypothetical protein